MKTAVLTLATSLAVASAAPGAVPSDVPINCAKPNASYCMAGDIILRCDGNSMGTRGRCSDNVAGYPPAGGSASCYQSSEQAGDAACMKNCVVYAAQSFTLPADKCAAATAAAAAAAQGSETSFQIANAGPATTTAAAALSHSTGAVGQQGYSETHYFSIPEGVTEPLDARPFPDYGETGIFSIPEGTSHWGSIFPSVTSRLLPSLAPTTTGFGFPRPTHTYDDGYPRPTHTYSNGYPRPTHPYDDDDDDDDCPLPTGAPGQYPHSTTGWGRGGSPGTTASRTNWASVGYPTLPATAGANANHAAGVLAAAGFVAALII
ncbi:hypothetical protein AAL_01269 [Moelleriella libera RCEF 2490]|uniref:Uncharacterized protein n=1 Tax=Moelleriella libera RCEF 2490 TaxID=1081109 RepID=A0A166VLY9_9HYPO|nr:hypothetical protein AAL_01269 [Moelleriella libera RCEF 2490]